jgi:hypothetical protein
VNPLDEFYARETRHFVIGDEQIVVLLKQGIPSLLAVASSVHVKAGAGESSGYELSDDDVVVSHQNASRADRAGPLGRVPGTWIHILGSVYRLNIRRWPDSQAF